MAIIKILTEPNKILREISQPVENVGKEEQDLMRDMLETMHAAKGIGLAAIQIGIPKRIIVIDLNQDEKKNSINSVYEEGCLSVPNQFAEVERPNKCEVEYLDFNGQKQLLKADGLLATCIQHEVDHLEGILFIDYLSKLKKSIILKKLSKNKPIRIVV